MDLTNAALLLAVAGGCIELVKVLLGRAAANPRLLVLIVLVCSFGATFALRYSVWSHEQVVGGKPLDALGVGSLIVVAFVVAFAESAAFLIVKGAAGAVANVGANQPSAYDPKYGQPVTMQDKNV